MLSAGFDGIKNDLTPPPSTDVNIYEMTPAQKKRAKIANMPASLKEALVEFKKNPISKAALGDHIFEKYVISKEAEWDSFRISVTDWEIQEYLRVY